jgi:Flp pilus assembly protein TadD
MKGSKEPRALDDEGVTCSVCHSIIEARLDGTGSYTIRRPALLARADGTLVFGDLTDEQILADIPAHRRAMMRPLLKTPEFCGACHKSAAPRELNGYKFIRGFSAYDEWQQSGASHESVLPFYRREQRMDCRACHMPKVDSANDRAAKAGKIASHRWPGANTAAPLFYQQAEQAEMTEKFLKANVLSVDIFAIKREATGETIAPLQKADETYLTLNAGEEITADVVIANRNAAHSFPPELRDMYEAWVEFEAIDGSGKTIFHSGFVRPDQTLDETTHVYKSILLDEQGRPITRHQVWLMYAKAYDNAIPAGRSDLVRFRFRVPEEAGNRLPRITLRARVNYRRFIQEYADYVLNRVSAKLAIPVVRMAEAETRLKINVNASPAQRRRSIADSITGPQPLMARRWNDYAIALLEQSEYGAAADAFRQASRLEPGNADLLINAAIAEMKTERFGPEREQWRKAALMIDRALKIDPNYLRARFYEALILRGEGRVREAAEALTRVACEYPRDREVQRQLGQTLFALGQMAEARAAFEAVLRIDPTDAGAYQFLASVYASEGRKSESARAESLYLLWRDDPLADSVAARFFSAHPQWSEERIRSHKHSADSPPRPTLTGLAASPAR